MEIIKKLIKFNFTKNANKPEFIVLHDTGNYNIGANAEMHYQYFNSGDKQSSAHIFVDDKQILQLVEIRDKSWHCGDGNNAYGINNGNSIGVEICINNDGNYLATINNTLELVSYLMKTYNISIDKVVRHYDASKKNCPQTMNNNGDWSKWNNFKERLIKMNTPQSQTNNVDLEFKANLELLQSYGKINAPTYWLDNCVDGGKVEGMYAKVILNKFAELLKTWY
jgi:N-acetylmuramoyl-L-alanine amidase